MSSCSSCSSSTSVIQQYLQQLSKPPAVPAPIEDSQKTAAQAIQPVAKNSDQLDITV